MYTILLRALLSCWCVVMSAGFIIDTDPCPAPSPCRCYSSRIDCAYKRLTSFPVLKFSQRHYRELEILLQRNIIESIPDNAFGNIISATPESVEIHLDKNRIHNISRNAFANFGDSKVTIELSENRLTVLPYALSMVKNLNTLRLLGNNFIYIDDTVMSSLGKTVETFWLDMSSVAIWPQSFSSFQKLTSLWIDYIPFHTLPSNSFEGLRKLFQLEISNSKLQSVPDAICRLPQLQQFRFNHNIYMLNSLTHILTVCKQPLHNASLAYFNNNNMFSFPENVFLVFPRIRSLNLSFNYLNSITSSAIPENCTLYYLYLSNNEFTSIPLAVSKMPELITLVISNNRITSVDGRVLSSLQNFRQLTISNNPLIFIDPHAFSTSLTLKNLYVEHTNITSVPAAILHSNERSAIDLTGSPVQCNCNNMAFLNSLSKSDVESGKKFFRGDCVNANMTIKSYILNVLPNCF